MYDLILVGGGLANGLIAWRLRQLRPELKVLLVEQGTKLGGHHTWSFYHDDVSAAQREWLQPLIVHNWPGYRVQFPLHNRVVATPYHTVTSERFADVLQKDLTGHIRFDAAVSHIDKTSIRIGDETLWAKAVIDGRGQIPTDKMRYAFQKFVGLEVRLSQPHGRDLPMIMDATIAQKDGYRFMYTLPFDTMHILIEDTYYSDTPDLDVETVRQEIAGYAAAQGWEITKVIRQETGVLPITLSGDIKGFWREKNPVDTACSGLRAALFHPTTGYSLLYAVRLADRLAALPEINDKTVLAATRNMSLDKWRDDGFFRLLNRMLFYAAKPAERYKILQRFYRLPKRVIDRFYAGHLNLYDKIRIVAGKPPVPLFAAFKAIMNGIKS